MCESRRQQAGYRILNRIDYGLVVMVERGVKYHGHTGALPERFDQPPIALVGVSRNRVDSSRSIDMRDCRQLRTHGFSNRHCEGHVCR